MLLFWAQIFRPRRSCFPILPFGFLEAHEVTICDVDSSERFPLSLGLLLTDTRIFPKAHQLILSFFWVCPHDLEEQAPLVQIIQLILVVLVQLQV